MVVAMVTFKYMKNEVQIFRRQNGRCHGYFIGIK